MRKSIHDKQDRKINSADKNPFTSANNKKNISKPILMKTLELEDSKQFNFANKNEITVGTEDFESSFEIIDEQTIPRASLPKSVLAKHVTSKHK